MRKLVTIGSTPAAEVLRYKKTQNECLVIPNHKDNGHPSQYSFVADMPV